MNLQSLEFSNLFTVKVSLSEEKIANNFKLIADVLKTHDMLRDKYDTLFASTQKNNKLIQNLQTRFLIMESSLSGKLNSSIDKITNENNMIKAEFITLKPLLEKMSDYDEYIEGFRRQIRFLDTTFKQFDGLRKDVKTMEDRNVLLLSHYNEVIMKKSKLMEEESEKSNTIISNYLLQIKQLKKKIQQVELNFIISKTHQPRQQQIVQTVNQTIKGQQSPQIDDYFKQKTLEKIMEINKKLQGFAVVEDLNEIKDKVKLMRKQLDDKMDMDEYSRILQFMNAEIRRCLIIRTQNTLHIPTIQNIPQQIIPKNQVIQNQPAFIESMPIENSERKNSETNLNVDTQSQNQPIILQVPKTPQSRSKESDELQENIKNPLLLKKQQSIHTQKNISDIKTMQTLKRKVEEFQIQMQNMNQKIDKNTDLIKKIEQLGLQKESPRKQVRRETEATKDNKEITKVVDGIQNQRRQIKRQSQGVKTERKEIHQPKIHEVTSPNNSSKRFIQSNELQLPQIKARYKNAESSRRQNSTDKSNMNISMTMNLVQKQNQKKIAEIKAETHYYFKELEKLLNSKQNKDDNRKKFEQLMYTIDEIKKLMSKKMDTETSKKNYQFLQNKINQIISIMIENEAEGQAVMVKRGWICLSCDKNLEKYQGKPAEHQSWNYLSGAQSPPRVNGFSGVAKYQQKYKSTFMDKEKEKQKQQS